MTTATDFRARALLEMGISTSSGERGLTNADMDGHVQRAVEEYTRWFPAEEKTDIAVSGGARIINMSSLTRPIDVVACEYPTGNRPRTFVDFDVWDQVVTLDHGAPTSGYTVSVYYTQRHLVDGSGSTIRLDHEDIVVEGIVALALLARATGAAQTADNVAFIGGGTPYHLQIAESRVRRWKAALRSLARVRRRSLYNPATGTTLKSVVEAPDA